MLRTLRTLLVVLALAVAFVAPSVTNAATQNGTTPETFTINSTIAATFPASASYTGQSGTIPSNALTITAISTNAPTYNVAMTTSAFTGGATIATTQRSRSVATTTGGCAVGGALRAAGFYATSGTSDVLVSGSACAPSDFPTTVTFTMSVNVGANPTPGSYSGTLSYTATAP